jgi:RNA polymerase sigma-70 factor (ECF subfamily)
VVPALPPPIIPADQPLDLDDESLRALFHAGDRALMGRLYQESFQGVDAAVGGVLRGADRETVVHELYLRLLDRPELRRNFAGGSVHAWLATLAHNLAVDFWRRHRRETSLAEDAVPPVVDTQFRRMEERAALSLFIERFRREALPEKWAPIFQARFVEQLDQREAARRLGVHRTTLAYRELRIRKLLRAYLRRRSPS